MIRVELGKQIRGKFEWHVDWPGSTLSGRSSSPLLAACYVLKRMGVDPAREIGLFGKGSMVWRVKTTVGYGASVRIKDDPSGSGVRIVPYRDLPGTWEDG